VAWASRHAMSNRPIVDPSATPTAAADAVGLQSTLRLSRLGLTTHMSTSAAPGPETHGITESSRNGTRRGCSGPSE